MYRYAECVYRHHNHNRMFPQPNPQAVSFSLPRHLDYHKPLSAPLLAVACPTNSVGTPPSCVCDTGYSGPITPAPAGYTGTCTSETGRGNIRWLHSMTDIPVANIEADSVRCIIALTMHMPCLIAHMTHTHTQSTIIIQMSTYGSLNPRPRAYSFYIFLYLQMSK